ncbi:DNA polymerase Y family protein [Marisediminicola senii]|uniref:DNA polymerase Y family protein n=1 Tax=Marisediminicola senii TaxID=2711233 RepID=UPI0013ECFCBD|nr:DNA polymerase Y family protein [Marisediminicola senii]
MTHETHHRVMRTIVLWCPDWPVTAAMRSRTLPEDAPVALTEKGLVFACSPAARLAGVRRGQRIREAQSRCPDLLAFPYEAEVDIRSFEPVLAAIEEVMPGVQLLRPGTCAIRSRGPNRFYGSDDEAALWLLDTLDALGIPDARVGVADGPFTAEYAARTTTRPRIRVVPEGSSGDFLAPLPVQLLDQPQLVTLLVRLGIRTLGEFAALSPSDVAARFGEDGSHLHALAGGLDSRRVIPRVPPRELDVTISFEPPLDRIDQVAFGFRASADRFVEQLTAAKLVCTSIRVEIDSDAGDTSERTWLHPRSFTPADVIDRIRWQLQGGGSGSTDSGLGSPICYVRVVPVSVDAIGNHEQGLWGTAADERIHHGLSRVQSMLGHGGVLTAVIGGGRTLSDRQNLVAWGDRPAAALAETPPWPGQLPTPAPSTVFERRHPVSITAVDGRTVTVDDRGAMSGVPAVLHTGQVECPIVAWAGPWPVDERWWAADQARRGNRFQVVEESGLAWLLVLDGDSWWAEARYD